MTRQIQLNIRLTLEEMEKLEETNRFFSEYSRFFSLAFRIVRSQVEEKNYRKIVAIDIG